MYKLTPKEIKQFDKIFRDKEAAKKTLDIALNFHANSTNKIMEGEEILWNSLDEKFDMDMSKPWTVDRQHSCIVVKEKD